MEPNDINNKSLIQINKNNCGQKEEDKEELFDNIEEDNKERKHLHKTKLNSCKQVRLKKFL